MWIARIDVASNKVPCGSELARDTSNRVVRRTTTGNVTDSMMLISTRYDSSAYAFFGWSLFNPDRNIDFLRS
jgi:hypothetical protein